MILYLYIYIYIYIEISNQLAIMYINVELIVSYSHSVQKKHMTTFISYNITTEYILTIMSLTNFWIKLFITKTKTLLTISFFCGDRGQQFRFSH